MVKSRPTFNNNTESLHSKHITVAIKCDVHSGRMYITICVLLILVNKLKMELHNCETTSYDILSVVLPNPLFSLFWAIFFI